MDDRRMKCERCTTRDHLRVDIQKLVAADRQTIKLRCIASIRWVRRIIWRDE